MEAQGKDNDRVKPYTASCRFQKDIENLSKVGLTPEDISISLDVPLTRVQKMKLKIAEYNEERRRFLSTGDIQASDYYGKPAVVTIFQR
jgi:hypothetical protein